MNPTNTNPVPSMELPDISPEGNQAMPEVSQAGDVTEIAAASALEQGVPVSQSPPPVAQPFDMNLGPQPAVSTTFDPGQMTPTPVNPSTPMAMPAIADDNDLIEKEWVVKAKQIVEHTQSDPHLQNKEMNKVKADYLKKRYNKEVKLVEE